MWRCVAGIWCCWRRSPPRAPGNPRLQILTLFTRTGTCFVLEEVTWSFNVLCPEHRCFEGEALGPGLMFCRKPGSDDIEKGTWSLWHYLVQTTRDTDYQKHRLGPEIQSPVISSSNENCSFTFHPFFSFNICYLFLDLESFKTAEAPTSTPSYFWSSFLEMLSSLMFLKDMLWLTTRYWNRYFGVRVRDRWWWKGFSYLSLQSRREHNCLLWLLLRRNRARFALAFSSPKAYQLLWDLVSAAARFVLDLYCFKFLRNFLLLLYMDMLYVLLNNF